MKKKKSDLIEYLEAIKKMQKGHKIGEAYYKWILENGKSFTKADKDDPKKFNKSFKKRFKGCYYNAQVLAMENVTKKLKYFEGWGITERVGIPLEHGFNVAAGKVIDISWKDGIEYFGVEIPLKFALKEMLRTESAGLILFKYWNQNINKDKKGKR